MEQFRARLRTIALTPEALARVGGSPDAPSVRLFACGVDVEPSGAVCDFTLQWSAIRDNCRTWSRDDVRNHTTASRFYAFYRKIGINPGKTPPSAANLLIRFAIGANAERGVPAINPVVDAGNVAQAETLVPIAIFDADALSGDMLLDIARPGDTLLAFGFAQTEPVSQDRLVLRDQNKVLSEFCYRDGQVQAVTPATRRLQVLACQVAGVPDETVIGALLRVLELLSTCHHLR